MRNSDRLTADHMATWRVTLFDGDGKPDPASAQEFRAVYYRADDTSPELTSFKNHFHKPVKAFVTLKIADIDRIVAPVRESEQYGADSPA